MDNFGGEARSEWRSIYLFFEKYWLDPVSQWEAVAEKEGLSSVTQRKKKKLSTQATA